MSKKIKRDSNIDFSKVIAGTIIMVLVIFSIWACIEYYVLVKLAILRTSEYGTPTLPDASLAIACITSILGVFASYCLYSFGLKNSLNKNGLEYDEMTGRTYRIPLDSYADRIMPEEIEQVQADEMTENISKDNINIDDPEVN